LSNFDEQYFIYAFLRMPSFGLTSTSLIEAYRSLKKSADSIFNISVTIPIYILLHFTSQ
jgi:hypothetical protein